MTPDLVVFSGKFSLQDPAKPEVTAEITKSDLQGRRVSPDWSPVARFGGHDKPESVTPAPALLTWKAA